MIATVETAYHNSLACVSYDTTTRKLNEAEELDPRDRTLVVSSLARLIMGLTSTSFDQHLFWQVDSTIFRIRVTKNSKDVLCFDPNARFFIGPETDEELVPILGALASTVAAMCPVGR